MCASYPYRTRRRRRRCAARCEVRVCVACMHAYIDVFQTTLMSIAVDYDDDADDKHDDDDVWGMFRSFEYYKITNYVSFDTPPWPPHTHAKRQPAVAVRPQRITQAFANKFVCFCRCAARSRCRNLWHLVMGLGFWCADPLFGTKRPIWYATSLLEACARARRNKMCKLQLSKQL